MLINWLDALFSNFASLTHSKGNSRVIYFIMCFCGSHSVCPVIKTLLHFHTDEPKNEDEVSRAKISVFFFLFYFLIGKRPGDKDVRKCTKVYTRLVGIWVARV